MFNGKIKKKISMLLTTIMLSMSVTPVFAYAQSPEVNVANVSVEQKNENEESNFPTRNADQELESVNEVIEQNDSEEFINEPQEIQTQSMKNPQLILAGIAAAFTAMQKIVGEAAVKFVKDKVLKIVDGLIKKYDSLDFIGSYRNKSEDNYTVFALAYKGKQIFRLDAKYLNHPTDGKSIWFHYHIAPNMSTHNDLGKVSIPSFPGWPF
ncbi:hypothetical protein P4S83_12640 [Aneurinibacillus thermoaerophilus]|uniref:hypothetical protein n=1 Tax=Aneurinibacillus thermoaerophilus TaxID=143495 RepID=UPI002E1D09EB|nr:hypothetical protein [Aneurinibacillus thermoaerophilus]MED0763576.1 hypothetical protein [Aneurinibacillus thermoaerophilus]